MKKTLKKLPVAGLCHAEWNPRAPEEMSVDNPDMEQLIASIREVGVVQPIAVWADAKTVGNDCLGGVTIAGNRRLEAARAAGLTEIPALVFEGISEAQAREITRIENEVRLGVDPIADAGLIRSMLGLGYSQKEIAAHFGVCEAKICRRSKLLDLIPKIREIAKGGKITTDALERIALYPEEIQEATVGELSGVVKRETGKVHWGDVSWVYSRQTMELKTAPFDTSDCARCTKRTGAQPDLWGDLKKDDDLGRCLSKSCYEAACQAEIERRIRDKFGDDIVVVDVDKAEIYYWKMEEDSGLEFHDKPVEGCRVAYFRKTYGLDYNIKFGPSLVEFRRACAAEKKRREDEERMRENESDAERLAREADEQRHAEVIKERNRLAGLVRDTEDAIAEKFSSEFGLRESRKAEGNDIAGTLLKCLSKMTDAQCAVIADYLCVSFEYAETDEDAFKVCDAFPEIAKAVGVTDEQMAACRVAKEAERKFREENSQEWA